MDDLDPPKIDADLEDDDEFADVADDLIIPGILKKKGADIIADDIEDAGLGEEEESLDELADAELGEDELEGYDDVDLI
jgi:hypothetical protein